MTESEWLKSDDSTVMLRLMNGEVTWRSGEPKPVIAKPSRRKLRLWVEACRKGTNAVREWEDIDQSEAPLDHFIESWASPHWDHCLEPAFRAALLRCIIGNPWRPVVLPARQNCAPGCLVRSSPPLEATDHRLPRICGGCGRHWECPWLTPQVVLLARAAYDNRAFDDLYAIADALLEAGFPLEVESSEVCVWCGGRGFVEQPLKMGGPNDGPEPMYIYRPPATREVSCVICQQTGRVRRINPHPLIAHLRGPGPHARGCWATDCILGKG